MSTQFTINGIQVTGYPIGRTGWYLGIPRHPLRALGHVLSGRFFSNPTLQVELDRPAPSYTYERPLTVEQHRLNLGLSRTKMAKRLGISRRSLGRWEQRGKLMRDVH